MTRNVRAIALMAMLAVGTLPVARREVAVMDADEDAKRPIAPPREYPYRSYRETPPTPQPSLPESRQARRARERAEAKLAARMSRLGKRD